MKWLKWGAAIFAGLIATGVLALRVLGQRDGARRTGASVEIARPPAEVWSWLEDAATFWQWVVWVTEVRDSGATRSVFMKDPNMNDEIVRVDSVVKERIPHQRLVVELTSPIGFSGVMTYSLEDLGGGRTRLTTSAHWVYGHWFASLMEPVVTPQANAKGREDLERLKRLAERRPLL